MADVEIVVKIPEETYNLLKDHGVSWLCAYRILNAVANGKLLPKGHGNLKDADKLKLAFVKWSPAVQGSFSDSDVATIVYHSPTIVEEDKEGKE